MRVIVLLMTWRNAEVTTCDLLRYQFAASSSSARASGRTTTFNSLDSEDFAIHGAPRLASLRAVPVGSKPRLEFSFEFARDRKKRRVFENGVPNLVYQLKSLGDG
jgi:hypothetical protein